MIRIEFIVISLSTGGLVDVVINKDDREAGWGHEVLVLVRADGMDRIRAAAPGYETFVLDMRACNL